MPYGDIIKVGAQGYGTQAHGPVPDGIFPFSEDVPQYTPGPRQGPASCSRRPATPDGGFDLTLTYASENAAEKPVRPADQGRLRADRSRRSTSRAQLFNQQWEEAKADPAKAQDIFVLYYWPTYSDAGSDNLYSLFHSSDEPFFNLSYWKNDQYDAADRQGRERTPRRDRDRAQSMYAEAMKLLYDQAPGAFLYDAQAVSGGAEGSHRSRRPTRTTRSPRSSRTSSPPDVAGGGRPALHRCRRHHHRPDESRKCS